MIAALVLFHFVALLASCALARPARGDRAAGIKWNGGRR